jgi:hypothetical protein
VRRPPPRRRRRGRRRLLVLLALGAAFVVGFGLGDALDDRPPGGTQTVVRTLPPVPVTPAPAETVTITTSNR